LGGNGPIDQVEVVDLRESMRNGGGPACLRLRVPLSPAALLAVDRRFLLTERRIDELATVVEQAWPDAIAPADLSDPGLWAQARTAHAALNQRLANWA
jgi:succinylarginine dihydrolase